MEVIQNGKDLIFKDLSDFDLNQILDSGQYFRFTPAGDCFKLHVKDKMWLVKQENSDLIFYNENISEKDFIINFFDLNRDYGKIKKQYLDLNDDVIRAAVNYGDGIRILKQDSFEMLITFIISQNNNIPRIKGIVEKLCECFGQKMHNENGQYYAFPTLEDLANVSQDNYCIIKCGFRAKYIIDAVQKCLSKEVDLDVISQLSFQEAKEMLLKIKGVGDKVANCVLLFGCGFLSAFPVDVWIKKVINELYGQNFDYTKFGDTAGIAQQYLFYYARKK